ncbi:MAG: NUDIX domain-containing protein [Vicingaceae bacterium]
MEVLRQFKAELKQKLEEKKPAWEAHRKVMEHRKLVEELSKKLEQARKSAVLLLIYPKNKVLHTVFIKRPTYEGVHSGQIALPGGAEEAEDQSLMHTALREAEEELAIQAKPTEVLGTLSALYVPPSNFLIEPYVAFQDQRPTFKADVFEVAEVIECPLSQLVGEDKLLSNQLVNSSRGEMMVRGFRLKEHLMWGATAMIVKEFAEILEQLDLDLR